MTRSRALIVGIVVFCIGAVIGGVFVYSPPLPCDCRVCTMEARAAVAQQDMVRDYAAFNDSYFDGQLPVNTVVKYQDDGEAADEGDTECELDDTDVRGQDCIIRVNAYYARSGNDAELTLMHEMCHVSLITSKAGDELADHGVRWQTCMRDLANAGAFDKIW